MTAMERTLGERLRARRWDELRLFQADVARAAGISKSLLSEIESDRTRVSEATLRRLATALRLDPDAVIADARRDGRIGPPRSRTTDDGPETVAAPIVRARLKRTPRDPDVAWLTADEAAEALGCTAGTVRHLLRTGVLAPTKRLRFAGRGPLRWFVSREAVLAYVPPNDGRAHPRGPRADPPPGYLTVDEYVEEFGIPKATLYRRIKDGTVASITVDGRRWVKDDECAC